MTARPVYAGLIQYRRARTTRTHVGVYDGDEAGMDTSGGEQPYSTVCEEHGTVCSHPTLRLAREFAAHPEEWCEVCMGNEPP